MSLKSDIKRTEILSMSLSEKPDEPQTDVFVGEPTEDDLNRLQCSDSHSKYDVSILRNADICVIVKIDGQIVCHTCIASDSFQHPRIPLPIKLENDEGFSYNSWTKKSHRGQGIFQLANKRRVSLAFQSGVRTLYSEIDSQNSPSLRAFKKAGFRKVGERYSIDVGEFSVQMVAGKSIYSDTTELTTQIGDIELAITRDDRFSRIARELEEYIDQWSESDDEVVLFGSGNHAQKIIGRTDLECLVSYAVDEDSSKIGSNVPNSDIPVRSIDELSKKDPNVIIICSEAFQSDMATRARAKSETADIIVLYPHVSRFEERD